MGADKAFLPFGPEVMLLRVVRILSEAVCPVLVVAAPGKEMPDLPAGVVVVRDEVTGKGPLQGLVTGLRALPDSVHAAYVSSCDVPLLRSEFVRHLAGLLGDSSAVVPEHEGLFHPLAAVYSRTVLGTAETMLKEECYRLSLLVDRCDARLVPVHELREVDPDLQSLMNLNHQGEYRRALRLAGLQPGVDGS